MVLTFIIIVLATAVGYYWLLSKYKALWESIEVSDYIYDQSFNVSILVPFRNEAKSLSTLLDPLSRLEIGKNLVEVIFINDHSTDNGLSIIQEYKLELDYRIITLSDKTGKKEAIKRDWGNAIGDIIIQLTRTALLTRPGYFQC